MRTRTLVLVLIAALAIVAGAIVLRGQGGRALSDWFVTMHGGR
jgi:hypothetical protein